MSAIFGLVNFNNEPASQAALQQMSAALAAHGAGGGLWTLDAIGLGQRQRCFTPQDRFEQQPLISADGQRVLISDARLDNRAELMSALAQPLSASARPLAQSEIPDSVLILHAYETWGVDCPQQLVGVFAFALWDAHTQQLLLARSPIAAPSLVYFSSPRTFAFATMPSGLHALPDVPRRLNEAWLADMLTSIRDNSAATLYRDIVRLPSGHRLTVGRDGVRLENYWRPDRLREIHFPRDADYLDAFNDLFTRVVGDQLRSATPVGIQMSGGLDSASVGATAARLLAARDERLTAFTEVPRAGFTNAASKNRYADETPFVQAVAAMYHNLDLNLMRTGGQSFLTDLDRLFAYLEEPFRNTSNRMWIEAILREARQRGIQVLLDGAQGNLTLSWNGNGLIPKLLRTGKWAQALQQARARVRNRSVFAGLYILLGQGILPLLPDPLWRAATWLRHPEWPTAQPWRAHSVIHPDFARAQHVAERARETNFAAHFRLRANTRQIRSEALAKQDGGMYLSAYRALYDVDMRTPPADARLAEFCLALPEDQYLRDGESRRLIRHAMAGKLPSNVLANQQRGLQAADWFERLIGARSQIAETLTQLEQSDLARRILDLSRLRQMFEQLPAEYVADFRSIVDYRFVFEPGLMIGRFLCWFESGA